MNLRVAKAVLLGFYAVLWVGGVVSHLLWRRTPPEALWTAPAFLGCAAALVLLDQRRSLYWLAGAGAAGFAAELAGTKVALFFGPYSYSGVLQPQLAGVPVVMACAWVILLAYVKSCLPALNMGRWPAVLAGAIWMVACDVVIDPVSTLALGYWQWHAPGPYYGVPFSNFTGWLVVSSILLATGIKFTVEGRLPRWLGFSVLAFFGLIAAAHRMPWPALAAALLCGWHLRLECARSRRRCSDYLDL